MRTVAIVDDAEEDIEALAAALREARPSSQPGGGRPCAERYHVTGFHRAEDLDREMRGGYHPDIVFIDIVLDPDGDDTGIDAVSRLFGGDPTIQVVYVSGYDSFHTRVYRTRHAAYLSKPFVPADVAIALEKAEEALSAAAERPLLFHAGGSDRVIPPASILYLESSLHVVRIHTSRDTIEVYGKLADALSRLPDRFRRCHQSFAVNLDAVSSLDGASITLVNGESIPVSRRMRSSVRSALFEYLRSKRP